MSHYAARRHEYDFRYLIQIGRTLADASQAAAQVRTLSYPPLVMRA
jgi:hypothetical protein